MADNEKGAWDGSQDSPRYEGQRKSVDMTDRKDSIVINEAADLYGDIQTAESEYTLHALKPMKCELTLLQSTATFLVVLNLVISNSSLLGERLVPVSSWELYACPCLDPFHVLET